MLSQNHTQLRRAQPFFTVLSDMLNVTLGCCNFLHLPSFLFSPFSGAGVQVCGQHARQRGARPRAPHQVLPVSLWGVSGQKPADHEAHSWHTHPHPALHEPWRLRSGSQTGNVNARQALCCHVPKRKPEKFSLRGIFGCFSQALHLLLMEGLKKINPQLSLFLSAEPKCSGPWVKLNTRMLNQSASLSSWFIWLHVKPSVLTSI